MMLKFDTPIQFVKGVGPKLGALLNKKGVYTVGDLIHFFPRQYEDRRAGLTIKELQAGQTVSLVAEVVGVKSFHMGRSYRKSYEVILRDQTGVLVCRFFKVPFRNYFEQFTPQTKVRVVGKVMEYRGRIEMHHPQLGLFNEEEELKNELAPIYSETEGLPSSKIRKLIQFVFEDFKKWPADERSKIEFFPKSLRDELGFPDKSESLVKVHFPDSEHLNALLDFQTPQQRRLIFEEFFWLELFMASRRMGIKKEYAPPMGLELTLSKKMRDELPFQLTEAQRRSFKEIVQDLTKPHPMHRLVQGDVGSGKTVVALLSACFAFENGFQTALMVPTEILAEQHFKNAQRSLEPLGIRCGLLVGSLKDSMREKILSQLKSGEIHVLIGTHALIQDPVEFKKLGLVIIDEQHRFGVEQRNRLKRKGESPHFLLMTATPIPRTLSLSVYGDLDISIINERPKGRQPIQTRVVQESQRKKMFEFIRDQIKKGRQAYIVYPLVEESEKIDLKDALTQYERLKEDFKEYTVGLLHGKMKAEEKDQVMKAFYRNDIQILVSTTVIEVGVDVPNANVMMIEHAERFGLSQLHQLRGRVGRGEHKSFCLLAMGPASSPEAYERCRIMEETDDGFKVSEYDLEIRGPGEFLGTRQSGLPEFKMANLVRDVDILQSAKKKAFEILQSDPQLSRFDHKAMREELLRRYKDRVVLG